MILVIVVSAAYVVLAMVLAVLLWFVLGAFVPGPHAPEKDYHVGRGSAGHPHGP